MMALPVAVWGQYRTEVTVTDLNDDALTTRVESNISNLISEINLAWAEKREPKWKACKAWADERTCNSLSMLWENSPFRCTETEVVEFGMTSIGGEYEVRNIPFVFTAGDEEDYHEAAITFNKQGLVTSFHMMISSNLYRTVMRQGADVLDLRRRQQILDYVEQFRTAYNTKDLGFLNQIFSEDALIITGKVIKVKPTVENNFTSSKIQYSKQDKKTYLSRLKGVFAANKRINVTFDDIRVEMHPVDEDIYGVTLHQGYSSDNYHDDGWLFLLWDFRKEDAPEIKVRTWQPDMNTVTQEKIKEDEIFGLADCPL